MRFLPEILITVAISGSLLVIGAAVGTGCATAQPDKQTQVTKCIKDLMLTGDVAAKDAFEICRQLYRVKKIKE